MVAGVSSPAVRRERSPGPAPAPADRTTKRSCNTTHPNLSPPENVSVGSADGKGVVRAQLAFPHRCSRKCWQMKRIGLFGFGRIGRNVFRMLVDHPELEVAGHCRHRRPGRRSPTSSSTTRSTAGSSNRFLTTTAPSGSGSTSPSLSSMPRSPGDADWSSLGVDLVVDSTSQYRTMDDARRPSGRRGQACGYRFHTGEARRHPGSAARNQRLDPQRRTPRSSPSVRTPPTRSLPILRILDNALGIERAFFTTVHAMTNDQRLADVPGTGFRTSRAAGENIIPAETNSPEILAQVMPELERQDLGHGAQRASVRRFHHRPDRYRPSAHQQGSGQRRRSGGLLRPVQGPDRVHGRSDRFLRCQVLDLLGDLRQPEHDGDGGNDGEDHHVVQQRLGLLGSTLSRSWKRWPGSAKEEASEQSDSASPSTGSVESGERFSASSPSDRSPRSRSWRSTTWPTTTYLPTCSSTTR